MKLFSKLSVNATTVGDAYKYVLKNYKEIFKGRFWGAKPPIIEAFEATEEVKVRYWLPKTSAGTELRDIDPKSYTKKRESTLPAGSRGLFIRNPENKAYAFTFITEAGEWAMITPKDLETALSSMEVSTSNIQKFLDKKVQEKKDNEEAIRRQLWADVAAVLNPANEKVVKEFSKLKRFKVPEVVRNREGNIVDIANPQTEGFTDLPRIEMYKQTGRFGKTTKDYKKFGELSYYFNASTSRSDENDPKGAELYAKGFQEISEDMNKIIQILEVYKKDVISAFDKNPDLVKRVLEDGVFTFDYLFLTNPQG